MTCASLPTVTRYLVSDLARSRAFYEGLLELTPQAVFVHENHGRIDYDVGAGVLIIANHVVVAAGDGASLSQAVVEVPNFDDIVADLRDARAHFLSEPKLTACGGRAVVADPDGHLITLQTCPVE